MSMCECFDVAENCGELRHGGCGIGADVARWPCKPSKPSRADRGLPLRTAWRSGPARRSLRVREALPPDRSTGVPSQGPRQLASGPGFRLRIAEIAAPGDAGIFDWWRRPPEHPPFPRSGLPALPSATTAWYCTIGSLSPSSFRKPSAAVLGLGAVFAQACVLFASGFADRHPAAFSAVGARPETRARAVRRDHRSRYSASLWFR